MPRSRPPRRTGKPDDAVRTDHPERPRNGMTTANPWPSNDAKTRGGYHAASARERAGAMLRLNRVMRNR